MPLIGANGGLLGSQRTTTTSTGVGLWTPNEQVVSKRAGVWPLSGDPYFGYNSLLLHMDGSNGSTTFTDNSQYTLSVTAVGNAQISTAQSKFGGASGYFDGTTSYCTVADTAGLQLGTGDFTIEAWVYATSQALNYSSVIATGQGAFGTGVAYLTMHGTASPTTGLRRKIVFGTGTTNPIVQSLTLLATNTWYHISISRSASTVRLFLDGILEATATNGESINVSASSMQIGRNGYDGAQGYWNGYIDELRITKGVARYTSNFTPSTTAFPNA